MDDLDNLENPLFKSGKNHFLKSSKISAYVTEFNNILNRYNNDYENKFKSKNLIATFKETYDKQMYIEIENKNNLIKLFEGKLANNAKFYRYAVKNPNKIKESYKILIPYLTARLYNIDDALHRSNITDKKRISFIIQDFYEVELREKLNLDYTQGQLLCKFALDLTKYLPFSNDKRYLCKLFRKAIIKLKVYNYDFMRGRRNLINYINTDVNPEVYATKLEEDSYNLGVYDSINISRKELTKLLINHIIENNYYNKPMKDFKAGMIIKKICYDLIDDEDNY